MLKIKKVIFFLAIIFLGIKGNSQENKDSTRIFLPISIYSRNLNVSNVNSWQDLNDKLDLVSYKFVKVDLKDIEGGFFSFSPKNLNRTPTTYIYDDYKKAYLNRQIFKGYDLRTLPWLTN